MTTQTETFNFNPDQFWAELQIIREEYPRAFRPVRDVDEVRALTIEASVLTGEAVYALSQGPGFEDPLDILIKMRMAVAAFAVVRGEVL